MKNRDINKTFTAILAMTVITAVLFSLKACAKEENPIGIITMTTKAFEVEFSVVVSGDVAIDWGDGKKSNVNDASFVNEDTGGLTFSHVYSGTTAQNIVITGNVTKLYCAGIELIALDVSRSTALTDLYCSYNKLTALDVSRNTTLTDLNCSNNQLTDLDVSKNIALESLELNFNQIKSLDVSNNISLGVLSIVGNQFIASALNDLFSTLPDRSKKEFGGVIYLSERHPLAVGNPGNSDCDRSIAIERGWGFMSWR